MKDDDSRLTDEEAEDLIASVLRRTTGGACGRAEALLCDFVDAELPKQELRQVPDGDAGAEDRIRLAPGADTAEEQLVAAHLEHCTRCAALAGNLRLMAEVLPSLAAFDPGPAFTFEVLAATSREVPAAGPARAAAWWRQCLARPRFAFEAAYVATLLLVLIAGNPAPALQAASARTATVAEKGLGQAQTAWPAAIRTVAPAMAPGSAVKQFEAASSGVVGRAVAVREGAGGLAARALQSWSSTWAWLAGTATDLVAGVRNTWLRVRTLVGQWTSRPAAGPGGRSTGTGAEPAPGRTR